MGQIGAQRVADDDEATFVDLHHAGTRQLIDVFYARDVGHGGACTDIDEDFVGFQQLLVDAHAMG
jgi:hypothetical protein